MALRRSMRMKILLGVLLACLVNGAASAADDELLFADGLETCSMMDGDDDRLRGCHELAVGTDPANADTDDDGLSDSDEVLGTVAGLDLPAGARQASWATPVGPAAELWR